MKYLLLILGIKPENKTLFPTIFLFDDYLNSLSNDSLGNFLPTLLFFFVVSPEFSKLVYYECFLFFAYF